MTVRRDAKIGAERFEQARKEAGIDFFSFSHKVLRNERGIDKVVLQLWPDTADPTGESIELVLGTPLHLRTFLEELGRKLAANKLFCVWEGYELELRGDAESQFQQLQYTLNQWCRRVFTLEAAEILDLSSYSQRVEGIGTFRPIATPFIARKSLTGDWVPENILVGISITPSGADSPMFLPLSSARIEAILNTANIAAEQGKSSIELPEAPGVILPLAEVIASAQQLSATLQRVVEGKHPIPEPPPTPEEKNSSEPTTTQGTSVLLLRQNIEIIDYREALGDLLTQTKHGLLPPPQLPQTLREELPLKPHQRSGLAWLQALWSLTKASGDPREALRGCILADDMGLGKTLQLLAFIHWLRYERGSTNPCLVVAPVALLENWLQETEKFFMSDSLRVLSLYGNTLSSFRVPLSNIDADLRSQKITKLLQPGWQEPYDLILTNYETLRNYEFSLARINFDLIVCDEAQKIKTPGTLITHAAKSLKARFKIACTGTPVENSLADLWCLFDFIQPGYLGSLSEFSRSYRRPIEAQSEEEKAAVIKLRSLIEPFVLRRMKTDVAKDLPPKIENNEPACRRLTISPRQRLLYQLAIRDYSESRNKETDLRQKGAAILGLLHRFRSICAAPCEPGLTLDLGRNLDILCNESPKLRWLLNTLDSIRNQQEKAIIFTEFRELQLYLQHAIGVHTRLRPAIVNGDDKAGPGATAGRQAKIDAFQHQQGYNCIILSPKAVGFGMNIQAANHVIHYTRAWNPAVENQATDRAYRIGQTKCVYVHYPTIVADDFTTFEEKLDTLLSSKRALADDMLNGGLELSIDEFTEGLDTPGSDTLVEDAKPIEEADLDRILGDVFEKFCVLLWGKQGWQVFQTPKFGGDGGIDLIAYKENNGLLIQCKSSSDECAMGWEAIKDVVAGEAAYHTKHPALSFKKVAVTNQTFNGTAKQQATHNEVKLLERTDLLEMLRNNPIPLAELSAAIMK